MKSIVLGCCLVFCAAASADDIRPLYVEIKELHDGAYSLRTKTPPRIPASAAPRIRLPDDCAQPGDLGIVRCNDGLDGRTLLLDYPVNATPLTGVVKVIYNTGDAHTLLLGLGDVRIRLPSRETGSQVAVDYTWMGTHHIWVGYDHLLFLLCLIWIAGDFRRILLTITGFTLAHSVTLALSALEIVRLPVPPVESVIALSVLFLAMEVAKGRRDNLAWKYPVVVSSVFGLLHGLGFAAVLNEVGLPQTEVLLGLVFFNVGVEIGQVLFAVVVVTMVGLLRRICVQADGRAFVPSMASVQTAMGYSVGIVAAYWLIDRTMGFV